MDLKQLVEIGWVAWGVLLTLFTMSVLSCAIVVERAWVIRRARRGSRACSLTVAGHLKAGRLEAALEAARTAVATGAHVAPVFAAGLAAWRRASGTDEARDAAHEAGRNAALDFSDEMRRGLPTLATVASTAPFVGLFGTTFGIINAFSGMALTGSGGIAAISAGIAEALITTAFGLFVAVPAVWAYNYFAGKVEGFNVEMDNSSSELLDYFIKKGA
jgi:biopolymer transport protein ExbB/TolQ